jgi:hypothetical protein
VEDDPEGTTDEAELLRRYMSQDDLGSAAVLG